MIGSHFTTHFDVVLIEALPGYEFSYLKRQYHNCYDPQRTLLKQGLIRENRAPYQATSGQAARTNAAVLKQLYQNN